MTHPATDFGETVLDEERGQPAGFLRLVSVDPSHNRYRFYTLSCEQTLWKEWAIRSTWGRIGGMGRSRIAYLGHRGGVSGALQELLEHRMRRGYRPANSLPPSGAAFLSRPGAGRRSSATLTQE